jgi:hypothetical protein
MGSTLKLFKPENTVFFAIGATPVIIAFSMIPDWYFNNCSMRAD